MASGPKPLGTSPKGPKPPRRSLSVRGAKPSDNDLKRLACKNDTKSRNYNEEKSEKKMAVVLRTIATCAVRDSRGSTCILVVIKYVYQRN